MVKDNLPLVSIIIPTYNYGQYLTEAIESAINQTYSNKEVLVVDDGSTDNTKDIVKKFNNIRYFYKKNSGAPDSRNFGVRKAKGEYIIFLDADNKLDPNYISKTYNELKKNPNVDFIYTQLKVFGSEKYITSFPDYNIDKLKFENYIDACSLLKKNVFIYAQYFNIKGLQDWDFYLSLAEKNIKGKLLNEPLLLYRKHDKGISLSISDNINKRKVLNQIFIRHWRLYSLRHVIGFTIGTILINLFSTNKWIYQKLQ